MSLMRTAAGAVLASLSCLSAATLYAQNANQTGDLTTFALTNPGASTLERNAAIAVQGMCHDLGPLGSGVALDANTPSGDLYRRCNELIQTAASFQPNSRISKFNGRSLGISQSQLLDSLQQVSGEEVSTRSELATQVSQGQFANISGRLSALRLGNFSLLSHARVADAQSDPSASAVAANGPSHAGYADYGSYASDQGSLRPVVYYYNFADATMNDSGSATPARGNGQASGQLGRHLGWFAEGSYNWGNRHQTTNEDGFDFKAESFTAGIDYNFGNAVLGVSAGYDHYRATFDNNTTVSGGDITLKGASGSIYGAWFSDLLFVNGIVSYGAPTTDLARNVVYPSNGACPPATPCPSQNRTLSGSPDSTVYAAGVTVGHDFLIDSWDLEASLAANYRHVKVDSFQENDTSGGGLALAYSNQTIESFRSILGLNLSRAISTSFGVVSPTVRLEWHREFMVGQQNLQAKYALDATPGSSPGTFITCDSCFAIPEDRPDRDFGVAGAGLSMVLPHRLQGYLFYERLMGESHLTSNAIALGIRGVF